jgi:ankyrin repeat protein
MQTNLVLIACGIAFVGSAAAAAPAAPAKTRVAVIEAAKEGDRQALQRLVASKVNVNAAEADGTTALHWAVRSNDEEAVRLLIRAGANVNTANRYGVTPLPLAAGTGNTTLVEALLKAGADPNSFMGAGQTALMVAARSGSVGSVKALLSRGAAVNAQERAFGQTALMLAAIENHAAVVQVLADAGANLDMPSFEIKTPEVKRDKAVASDGARGSFPKGGMTALLLAARQGAVEGVRALVYAGAAIDKPQSDGITPLIMSIFNAHYDVAAALLEMGADPRRGDSANRTPLFMATDMHTLEWLFSRPTPRPSGDLDSVDLVKMLLAYGADPNVRLTKKPAPIGIGGSGVNASLTIGSTPLMKAATTSDMALMKILLAAGADPNLTTEDRTTAFMMAAGLNWHDISSLGTDKDSLDVLQLLIDLGADVNAFNDEGLTALHGAAQRGSVPIVEFLIAKGAKLNVKNKRGRTPLDEAIGDEGLNGERRPVRTNVVALLSPLKAGSSTR